MFIGEFRHSIDEKGRVAIPAKFRAKLAGGCVITRGLDNCLTIYPQEEWDKLAKKLSLLPVSKSSARVFSRLMLSGAFECELDRQGRITVSGYLRDYANLESDAVITGIYNRIEVWSPEEWEKYKTTAEEDGSNLAEQLGDII